MAWIYDPVWSGSDGLGMAWHGKVLLERLNKARFAKAGLVKAGYGVVWHGLVFPIRLWCGKAGCGVLWFGSVC